MIADYELCTCMLEIRTHLTDHFQVVLLFFIYLDQALDPILSRSALIHSTTESCVACKKLLLVTQM